MRKYSKGEEVEVSSNEEGFRGAWFRGVVVQRQGKGYIVEYKELLSDKDHTKHLREKIEPGHLRPAPPNSHRKSFTLFQEVDAYDNDGWWVGIVNNVIGEPPDATYSIYFMHTREQVIFPPSKLRPHLEYINGQWVEISQSLIEICTGNNAKDSAKSDGGEIPFIFPQSRVVSEDPSLKSLFNDQKAENKLKSAIKSPDSSEKQIDSSAKKRVQFSDVNIEHKSENKASEIGYTPDKKGPQNSVKQSSNNEEAKNSGYSAGLRKSSRKPANKGKQTPKNVSSMSENAEKNPPKTDDESSTDGFIFSLPAYSFKKGTDKEIVANGSRPKSRRKRASEEESSANVGKKRTRKCPDASNTSNLEILAEVYEKSNGANPTPENQNRIISTTQNQNGISLTPQSQNGTNSTPQNKDEISSTPQSQNETNSTPGTNDPLAAFVTNLDELFRKEASATQNGNLLHETKKNHSAIPSDIDEKLYSFIIPHLQCFQDNDDCSKGKATLKKLRLAAYFSVLQVLYIRGSHNWKDELLLTSLREALNISNEEHATELKRVTSGSYV